MQKISSCCEAIMSPEYQDSEICPECNDNCGIEEVFECDECEDTGEVAEDVLDEDSHEYTKQTKPCICTKHK